MKHSVYLGILLGACLLISVLGTSQAATILYDFPVGSTAPTPSVTGSDAGNLTASDFTATGGTVSTTSGTAFFNASNTADSAANALTTNRYFSFTLTADPGFFLNVESFTIDFGGNRGASDADFTSNILVQSSVGGFGTGNPTLTVTPSSHLVTGTASTYSNGTVNVSGSEFDNLSSVTFQIRMWDDTSAATSVVRVDNVSLNVAAVPEPSSAALLVATVGLFLTTIFRKRRSGSAHQWQWKSPEKVERSSAT